MNVELSQDDVQNIINAYDKDIKKMEEQEKEIDRLNNIINIKNDYIIQLHNLIYKTDNPNLQFALHIKQEKYLKELKEE